MLEINFKLNNFEYLPCEVTIKKEDDFLKIRETLTRIGVQVYKEKKIMQSCHILHKQGRYAIVHFKELFALDGYDTDMTDEDIERRNRIVKLLEDWGLLSTVTKEVFNNMAPMNVIKVIGFKDKNNWTLEPVYTMRSNKKEIK